MGWLEFSTYAKFCATSLSVTLSPTGGLFVSRRNAAPLTCATDAEGKSTLPGMWAWACPEARTQWHDICTTEKKDTVGVGI